MFSRLEHKSYSFQKDLRTLKMMVNRLETYVCASDILGNLGMFRLGLPAVTIGGILLRFRRLRTLQDHLNKPKQTVLDRIISQHEVIYQKWTSLYQEKLLVEVYSRIDRIAQFITEFNKKSARSMISFEPEQIRRTIVQESIYLMRQINLHDYTLVNKLSRTEMNLREIVTTSRFQWQPILKPAYPSNEFWWLYGKLSRKNIDE